MNFVVFTNSQPGTKTKGPVPEIHEISWFSWLFNGDPYNELWNNLHIAVLVYSLLYPKQLGSVHCSHVSDTANLKAIHEHRTYLKKVLLYKTNRQNATNSLHDDFNPPFGVMSKRIINVKQQSYLKTGNIHTKFWKHRFTSVYINIYVYTLSPSNSLLWYPLKKQSTPEKCWVPTCLRALITSDLRSSHCPSCKKTCERKITEMNMSHIVTPLMEYYIGTHPVQLSISTTSPPWLFSPVEKTTNNPEKFNTYSVGPAHGRMVGELSCFFFFPKFRGHTCSMWKNSRAEPFPFTNMDIFQVVVSTQLKNISQNWNLLRIRDEQNKIFETTTEFFGVLGLQVIQDSPPSK